MTGRVELVEALARGLYENGRDTYNGDLGPYNAWPSAMPEDRDEFTLRAAELLADHDDDLREQIAQAIVAQQARGWDGHPSGLINVTVAAAIARTTEPKS